MSERLTAQGGITRTFNRPVFHEAVLRLEKPTDALLKALLAKGILGGFDLSSDYPELGNALLVCATETKCDADLDRYAAALAEVLG